MCVFQGRPPLLNIGPILGNRTPFSSALFCRFISWGFPTWPVSLNRRHNTKSTKYTILSGVSTKQMNTKGNICPLKPRNATLNRDVTKSGCPTYLSLNGQPRLYRQPEYPRPKKLKHLDDFLPGRKASSSSLEKTYETRTCILLHHSSSRLHWGEPRQYFARSSGQGKRGSHSANADNQIAEWLHVVELGGSIADRPTFVGKKRGFVNVDSTKQIATQVIK
jgi:hypothetical protein